MERAYIEKLFADPEMIGMGHNQRREDLNLGLGWINYSLVRVLRPQISVVIGSWKGFIPIVMAKGMQENTEAGELHFLDPSLGNDFWKDPENVRGHFRSYDLQNITHHAYTTQDFVGTREYSKLEEIGLLMIDGYHTAEQARFDYLAFLGKLSEESIVLFHDSLSSRKSKLYGEDKAYNYSVWKLIERLKELPELEVFSFPIENGLTMVRGKPLNLDLINKDFED